MDRSQIYSHAVRAGVVALSLSAFHCMTKPVEPVMPTWDVNLVAPVANRTYTLGELAEKDPSLLGVAPGGTQIMLKTSVQADPTYVGDRISLEPVGDTVHSELGPFSVSSGGMRLNVQLPGFTPGMRTVIPPLPPVDVPASSGSLPFVQQMVLLSGTVELRLWNRMPVALRFENPLTLANESGSVIGSFDFGTTLINAGETRTVTTSLAGKTVYQHVRLSNMRVSSPGSGTSTVTIPDTMLLVDINPFALVATSAILTNIAPQHLEETRNLPLSTQTLVRDVWINRGTLNLYLRSRFNLPGTLRLRLPELLRPSGQPYEQIVVLPPQDSVHLAIDLARFHLHSPDGSFLHTLRAECVADMAGGTGQAVSVSSTDYVSARVTTSTIYADSAVAALAPTVIAIDERIGLNLGEVSKKFRGNLDIPGADMVFTPHSSIVMPMELRLRFEARNASGNTVTLNVPVTKGTHGLDAITFAPGDVGRFLTSISGILPDSLRVVGTVVLNPDYDTTAPAPVGRNCAFAGDVNLSIPMSLRITNGHFADTLVMGDTTGDGNADDRLDEETISDFNYGKLHVEIENGLPLDVKVKVGLLDGTRRMLLAVPQTEGDSIAIAGGSVVNGDVQTASRSVRTLDLLGTDLRQFNLAELVKVDLALASPGSTTVNFRTTDRVRVKMWTEFSYRVNP